MTTAVSTAQAKAIRMMRDAHPGRVMTSTLDPATCRKLGGCMHTNGACIYCNTPSHPLPPMAPVPINCGAIRHTNPCTCNSARARLPILIAQLRGTRRPWWRG